MEQEIERLVSCMQNGGTILYPTDTIWGLGCDAHNEKAIQRILDIKQRPEDKGLILLVDDIERLRYYVSYVPEKAANLIEHFRRPLTIIYPDVQHIPAIALPPSGSVAIRVCQDAFCCRLIARLDRAIISTSANISGQPSAPFYRQIAPDIIASVDAVAEHRQEEFSKTPPTPSTIIQIAPNGDLIFIRK